MSGTATTPGRDYLSEARTLLDDIDSMSFGQVNKALDHLANLLAKASAPSAPDLAEALQSILDANDDFRKGMPDGWEGDPLQDACTAARAALSKARGEV